MATQVNGRGQGESRMESRRAAGVAADVVDASDRSHGEINSWFGPPDDSVTQRALAFLEALWKPGAGRDIKQMRGLRSTP